MLTTLDLEKEIGRWNADSQACSFHSMQPAAGVLRARPMSRANLYRLSILDNVKDSRRAHDI